MQPIFSRDKVKYIHFFFKIEPDVDNRKDDDASPDVILIKNEGSMVQTCRNINVHVVNTNIC